MKYGVTQRRVFVVKCLYCGKEFEPKIQRKDVRFCSSSCGGRYRKRNHRIKDIYICKYCHKEFSPKGHDRITYCSRECAFADKKASPIITIDPECVICGIMFKGKSNAKCCSDTCREVYKKRKRLEYKQSDAYQLDLDRQRNEYIKRPLKIFVCKTCNAEFKSKASHAVYCSDRCNPLVAIHKGKVSKGVKEKIWKRDNYICKLCNKPMDMDKASTLNTANPHSMAPTIDHIVPVSTAKELGWSNKMIHAESNLQAAHFICNTSRGNKSIIN
jgi:hypothetical protein